MLTLDIQKNVHKNFGKIAQNGRNLKMGYNWNMPGKIQFLTERLVTYMIDSFWDEKLDKILKTQFFSISGQNNAKNALKTTNFC